MTRNSLDCCASVRAPNRLASFLSLQETREHRETQLKMWSPCLLPDMQMVRRIEVCSPRYFRLRLDIAGSERHATFLRNKRCIFVQRKAGHLSYELDAKAVRGLHARSFADNSGMSETRVKLSCCSSTFCHP